MIGMVHNMNTVCESIAVLPLSTPVISNEARVTLNIGLGGSTAYGKYKKLNLEYSPQRNLVDILNAPYKVATVLEQVRDVLGVEEFTYTVAQSSSEATLVIELTCDVRKVLGNAFALSEVLAQDCIAVWVHNDINGGVGQLMGRYHYVWGEFNKDYFIFMK